MRQLTRSPLLPQTLSNIRSISSLLLGISAGILGLESTNGFLYYILGSFVVSVFIHFLLVEGQPEKDFAGNGDRGVDGKKGGTGAWGEVWFGGGVLGEALSGYVLGWAGVGGVIR
jgi:ER membrane protein complex subunit 6